MLISEQYCTSENGFEWPDPCQRLSFDDQLTVTHKPSYTKNYEKKIQCTCKSASKNILIKTWGQDEKKKKSLSFQIFVLIIFSSSHVYCLNMFFDGIRLTYIEDRNLCTFSTNLWFKICCWKMLPNLRHICSTHLFCAHQEKHVLNVSSMTITSVRAKTNSFAETMTSPVSPRAMLGMYIDALYTFLLASLVFPINADTCSCRQLTC